MNKNLIYVKKSQEDKLVRDQQELIDKGYEILDVAIIYNVCYHHFNYFIKYKDKDKGLDVSLNPTDTRCSSHKKSIIDDVHIGVNRYGYTMAHVSCRTKRLSVLGYSTPHHSDIKDMHQNYAAVYIGSDDEDYHDDSIKIPFEPEEGRKYTILNWIDKDTIIVIIVPIEFLWLEC